MVRTLGAQIGLLALAVAIIAGLYAGNSPTVILWRALLATLIGVIIGQLGGWAAKMVLREHLLRKKLHIDRLHLEAVRAMTSPPAEAEVPTANPIDEPVNKTQTG